MPTPLDSIATLMRSTEEDLWSFTLLCQNVTDVSPALLSARVRHAIWTLKLPSSERSIIQLGSLEEHWYASVQSGSPDYAIYDTDEYLVELFACWRVYSRRYLRDLLATRALPTGCIYAQLLPVKSVLDLGCGIGFSTAALTQLFPKAEVIGTNLPDTKQTAIAKTLGKRYGFDVFGDVPPHKFVDVVFASEYFEHFQQPIDHLTEVLDVLNPVGLLVANSFGGRAVGHFNRYEVSGRWVDGKFAARLFNDELRSRGYVQVQSGFWNNRPSHWKKLPSSNDDNTSGFGLR